MKNNEAPTKIKEGKVIEAPDHEFWVRTHDNVRRTADDLLEQLKDSEFVDMACIGAACVNQGLKALAVARDHMKNKRWLLLAEPFFSTIIDDENRERTRLMIRVHKVLRDDIS